MSEATEPAFPQHDVGGETSWPGMMLRDWFAGRALEGLASKMTEDRERAINNGDTDAAWEAQLSYKMANSMLKARDANEHDETLIAENTRLRDALTSIEEYWNGDSNDKAMTDALDYIVATAGAALAEGRS
jgi:hypothetical protein